MSAEIRILDRPTTPQALQEGVVDVVQSVLDLAKSGEINAIVIVPIRADGTFRVLKAGSARRLQTVGYLAQAQYDLLRGGDE